MFKEFLPVLWSGLEFAFALAVLSAWLESAGLRRWLSSLKTGAWLSLVAGAGLAFGVVTFLSREPVLGIVSLLAAFTALAVIIVISRSRKSAATDGSSGIRGSGLVARGLAVVAFIFLVLPIVLDAALRFSRLLSGAELSGGEMATRLLVGVGALGIAGLLGIFLRRAMSQVRGALIALSAAAILLLIFLQ
ncbi:MAG: hypothetical protein ABID71_04025, partial [Chloroflexota bacterium]